jgi:hypothetical protein
VMSVKRQRFGAPSSLAPICTTSLPIFRPVWRSSCPDTGLIHRMR